MSGAMSFVSMKKNLDRELWRDTTNPYTITACACLGPMYGEPFCCCQMRQYGWEEFMEKNPLRIAENERSAAQWKAATEPGGWLYEIRKRNVR